MPDEKEIDRRALRTWLRDTYGVSDIEVGPESDMRPGGPVCREYTRRKNERLLNHFVAWLWWYEGRWLARRVARMLEWLGHRFLRLGAKVVWREIARRHKEAPPPTRLQPLLAQLQEDGLCAKQSVDKEFAELMGDEP